MNIDRIVSSRDVLGALMRLRRQGHQAVMEEMEKLEPDLTEYLLEELSAIHQQIVRLGVTPKRERLLQQRIEALGLVLVMALRQAQRRLWNEQMADTPLAQIDPDAPPATQNEGEP